MSYIVCLFALGFVESFVRVVLHDKSNQKERMKREKIRKTHHAHMHYERKMLILPSLEV